MKHYTINKKLVFYKITIAHLECDTLDNIRGGVKTNSCNTCHVITCDSCFTCVTGGDEICPC
jgi:hypothetical protein